MATTAVGQLREQVRGEIITAEDPGYDEARRARRLESLTHPRRSL
jgi:hypothetical protein